MRVFRVRQSGCRKRELEIRQEGRRGGSHLVWNKLAFRLFGAATVGTLNDVPMAPFVTQI